MTHIDKIILHFCLKIFQMNLKELILEILKRGGKYKSKEIARRASILDNGMPYTKEDVKNTIFKELYQTVNYDKLTFEYFIIDKSKKSIVLENKDLVLETLKSNNDPMSIIDISNTIRRNHKKNISIDDILLIIVKELRYEVGIEDGKLMKYYIR